MDIREDIDDVDIIDTVDPVNVKGVLQLGNESVTFDDVITALEMLRDLSSALGTTPNRTLDIIEAWKRKGKI